MIQKSCMHLFLINHLVIYKIFHLKKNIFLNTCCSEFSYIDVWIIDQTSKPLEIEDKLKIFVKGCGFLSFLLKTGSKNIGKNILKT